MRKTALFSFGLLCIAIGETTLMGQHPAGFFTDIRPVPGLASSVRDEAPYVSPDGRTIYFNSDRGYVGPLDRNKRDIWMATRNSVSDAFSEPSKVPAPVSIDGASEHYPYLTDDGRHMYFSSTRLLDVSTTWVTSRESDDSAWSEPMPLLGEFVDLPNQVACCPELSQDELTFYFSTSSRTGNLDLFYAKRDSTLDDFGPAQSLGNINTNALELNPSLSADELTLFYWLSPNPDFSFGEIYVATRQNKDDDFGEPVPINDFSIGSSFETGNVARADPFISRDWPSDGSKLYFTFARSFNDFDIYEATWRFAPGLCDLDESGSCGVDDVDLLLGALGTEDAIFDLDGSAGPIDRDDLFIWLISAGNELVGHPLAVGDTNLDGRVDAADLNTIALNWQAMDAESWAQGDFNGDGDVDAGDLNSLALNWQSGVDLGAGAPVPEPSAFTFAFVFVLWYARIGPSARQD